MKAVTLHEFGPAEVLRHGETARPEPRPGYVRMKVDAAGVNYYDTLVRAGAVTRDIRLPHVVGSDAVGEIDALGRDVADWSVGERVIVAPGYPADPAEWNVRPENHAPSYYPAGTFAWGGYAQFMEVPARWLLPDDTGLPAQEVASLPLVLTTAVHAVRTLGGVCAHSRVLVQAGASGSGSMAIQVAKALGASVIATASTSAKATLARRAGADEVIRYRDCDVVAAVREWTRGDGVDVVIDPVGGAAMAHNIESLRPRGIIVNFGLAGGAEGVIPNLYKFFRNELRLVGSWMGSTEELRYGLELVRAGAVRPMIDRVLPLAAAREAHGLIARAEVAGKLVLLPWR